MQIIPSITTVVNISSRRISSNPPLKTRNLKHQALSPPSKISQYEIPTSVLSLSSKSGVCRASQVAELFPTTTPEIVVREARIDDCWEVAETHCNSFFPEYSFPLDFVLRFDRLIGMLFGLSTPKGCKRTCLVAVTGNAGEDLFFLSKGYVTGILTVDTVADFLPRKGPLRQRRTGIAYISNVAVRERFRRKGVAKKLIAKAEAKAKSWGCRAIALHCEVNNTGATKLYTSQGFRCIKVPEGANWPHPRTSPDTQFSFMMKLL